MRTAEYFGDQEGMEIFPGINKHHSEKFFRDHDLTWSYPRQCINRELMAYVEMGCFACIICSGKNASNSVSPS